MILAIVLLVGAALASSPALASDSCSQNINIPNLPFSSSSLSCQLAWSSYNFVLRHHYNTSSGTLSILLSADTSGNWFSMGLSPSGSMIGSSAMVGYQNSSGVGVINQYYLAGMESNLVLPREGNLTVIENSGMVVVESGTIYMAFQLHIDETSAASSQVIYAYAYQNEVPDSNGNIGKKHQGALVQLLDFTTGASTTISTTTMTLRRSHGIVNIFGWAVCAPIGAFIARYLRPWNPGWFYLHIGFQISAFLFGITGVAMGVKLSQEITAVNWHGHRMLGISILVLGVLQVIALCGRPNKDSKYRTLWNWYHRIVGQILLFLAAINILIGIKLADAGPSWKAGYGVILVLTLVSFIILESVHWYKWYKGCQDPLRRTNLSTYEMM